MAFMAFMDGPWIVPANSMGDEFRQQIIHPDPEAMRRRDAFFAELDQMNITENEDGSVELEFTLGPPVVVADNLPL